MTQITGAYAVAWDQVQVNGQAASVEVLAPGDTWQWQGDAVRLNGPPDVFVLETPVAWDDTRRRVALKLGQELAAVAEDDDPADGFVLTDARRQWRGRVVARPGGGDLCVFDGGLPPAGVRLWVVSDQRRRQRRVVQASGVVAGTMVQTTEGPLAIESLFPGDRVRAQDGSWQEVLWVGTRTLTGAQLWAEPDLAPVRLTAGALGAGALGTGAPSADVLLAPDHHVALCSARARALFGADRVLVRARDLLDSGGALRAMGGRDVTYVSVAFDAHGLIDIAGLAVESYHPLTHDRKSAMPDDMGRLAAILPELLGDPAYAGPLAARCLSRAETAILRGL